MKKAEKPKPLEDDTKSFLNNASWQKSLELAPEFWQKLEADLGPLPQELKNYFQHRLYAEILLYWQNMVALALNLGSDKEMEKFLHVKQFSSAPWSDVGPIMSRTRGTLLKELAGYQRKYKEDMSRTVAKAKDGEAIAICRLLQWDKTWVAFEFIGKEFSRRVWADEDTRFFDMAGDALKRKSGIRKETRTRNRDKDLLLFVRLYLDRHGPLADHELRELHTRLFEDLPHDSTPLQDFDYFKKYLKRHHVI